MNQNGPNELRFVRVAKTRDTWQADILDEAEVELSEAERKRVGLNPGDAALPSHRVALDVADAMASGNRNLLFYVHGFNSSMKEVLERCLELKKLYGVEVLAFSWPANAGGFAASIYDSDKLDARASGGALERTLNKFAELANKLRPAECKLKVSMLLHSMGNFVYQQVLQSGVPAGHTRLFDNVTLVAADCNNKDHIKWVENIKVRNRVYITINEQDDALGFSEQLHGLDQLERLGQHLGGLDSKLVRYINFTDADRVRGGHSYFVGAPVEKNKDVKNFFNLAVNGGNAEDAAVGFVPFLNFWRMRRFGNE